MLHVTAKPRSKIYRIIFIKTENIAVDEIGRIICSHLLARACWGHKSQMFKTHKNTILILQNKY